ncbi:hypothetical protein MWU59_02325 [Flavobacteriaceae bacterium F08102]|nr:hypothetical protein [Flavobacteriaceae bacterium F08102]
MHLRLLYVFSLLTFNLSAQNEVIDSTLIDMKNADELLEEQRNLNFEQFFFTALQQKAIGNFDKAISALESCQSIKKDLLPVLFEFGKNYFSLEKYPEAEGYTKKALKIDSTNVYVQLLLRDIYSKQNKHLEALEIQKKIADKNPDKQLDLVILYIKNNQIENARTLLLSLEKQGVLASRLIPFKEALMKGKIEKPVEVNQNKDLTKLSLEELRTQYATDKSFNILRQYLLKLYENKKIKELLEESKNALELYPAQPFVYLMQGNGLNQSKQYENALLSLELGLDYLIDNTSLEADFYEAMSLSYKGLNQNVKASNSYNKAIALRQKKL